MPKKAERINRTDDFDDAAHNLGDSVLIESELELKLYYYEDLAMRQKKAARQMKRRDLVSYYLNMSDHFSSLAKAEMIREDISENKIAYQRCMRDVKACHIPTSEEAIAYTEMKIREVEEEEEAGETDVRPESDEVLGGGEAPAGDDVVPEGEDPFAETDQPVDLRDTKELPKVEPDIDDAS